MVWDYLPCCITKFHKSVNWLNFLAEPNFKKILKYKISLILRILSLGPWFSCPKPLIPGWKYYLTVWLDVFLLKEDVIPWTELRPLGFIHFLAVAQIRVKRFIVIKIFQAYLTWIRLNLQSVDTIYALFTISGGLIIIFKVELRFDNRLLMKHLLMIKLTTQW